MSKEFKRNIENIEKNIKNLNEEIVNNEEKIKALEQKRLELKRNEEKEGLKKYPAYEDVYFLLNSHGNIECKVWYASPYDFMIWDNRCGFFTKENAEFEKERRKVKREMEEFTKHFDIDEKNWNLEWCYIRKTVLFEEVGCKKGSDLYFESKEKIKEMLNAIGEDRVKKYYLGVCDE